MATERVVDEQPKPAQRAERPTPKFIGVNGKIIPWDQATVHITQVGWPAVSSVFEGIRAYWNDDDAKLYVFHLDEHMARLGRSMKLMRMASAMSPSDIGSHLIEVLRANEYRQDCYIQPIAYMSGATSVLGIGDLPTAEIVVNAMASTSNLLNPRGYHTCISSWIRISENVMSPRIKALPNYLNSRMASVEARNGGYDAGIILNEHGKVAEGGASCIYIVRDGVAITPPLTAGILESITRLVVKELLEKVIGLPVVERDVDRTEMYIADEAFFCGTSAEITPILSVDRYILGDGEMGPITAELEKAFHDACRGIDKQYMKWLTPV